MMSQLSGGQKALVAMALIFAIQRCDPAPFYLFDELDQALDSTYRSAVAALIQRQAQSEETPTQFITSTFRPELVAVASRCYGISHQSKVSSLHSLTKKDSLSFISNLMSEEEAVGGNVSVLPAVDEGRLAESASSVKKKKGRAAGGGVEEEDGDSDEDDSDSGDSDDSSENDENVATGANKGKGKVSLEPESDLPARQSETRSLTYHPTTTTTTLP